jgi:translation initiation factor IF-1
VNLRGAGLAEVELANGHRLLGHMRRRDLALGIALTVGMKVMVELKPYDLSAGRMTLQTN